MDVCGLCDHSQPTYDAAGNFDGLYCANRRKMCREVHGDCEPSGLSTWTANPEA